MNKNNLTEEYELKIAEFNKKHCVVLDGDKTRVFIDSFDTLLDRQHYKSVSFQTFREMYEAGQLNCGYDSNGKILIKTPANAWLSSIKRKEYLGGVIFDPSGKDYNKIGMLNLWRGYSVTPKKGDWEIIKTHIKGVICNNDDELFNYVLGWLALTLQQPDQQTQTALVLRGKKGSGKGLIGHLFRSLFGSHGLHITSAHHLTGKFNSHLRDCAFLFVDEALYAGDKQHENILKGLITEPVITIEGKGANAYQSKNMLSMLMASNEQWVIPASSDERRYCVMDVNHALIGNESYYTPLVKACKSKRVKAAMLYDLLHQDLSEYDVRKIPETEALKDQRAESMDSLGKWWLNVLSRGFIYHSQYKNPNFTEWLEMASTTLLKDSYLQFCNEYKLSKYDIKDEREQGKFLAKFYSRKRTRKQLIVGETLNGLASMSQLKMNWYYDLGTLEQARAKFCEIERINHDFNN